MKDGTDNRLDFLDVIKFTKLAISMSFYFEKMHTAVPVLIQTQDFMIAA